MTVKIEFQELLATDDSGFQTEHTTCLEKLAAWNVAKEALTRTIEKVSKLTDTNLQENQLLILESEIAKLTVEKEYIEARQVLAEAVLQNISDEGYLVLP